MISHLEERVVKITDAKKKYRWERNEKSKETSGKILCTNIHLIGVLEGENREKGVGNITEFIIEKTFLT